MPVDGLGCEVDHPPKAKPAVCKPQPAKSKFPVCDKFPPAVQAEPSYSSVALE